jgi:carbonic anhydrase/acetyltransferase-like protein (isoleucine patch superfamily)
MENKGIEIDPTAFVHPTAVLEGNVVIGAYSEVGAGCILTGNVTIGHHTWLLCGIVLRGTIAVGNYVHIYDLANIEGGRPKMPIGSSTAKEAETAVIGDYCWVNHGAVMHGTHMADEASVGGNTFCDYGTKLGKGAILGNGSATNVEQVIPDNCLAEGVPAKVVRNNLTDDDRQKYFGLLPKSWTIYVAERLEKKEYQEARKKKARV